MSAQSILILCYITLALLLLLSLKHSSLARPFKLGLVVITSVFYMVTWFHILDRSDGKLLAANPYATVTWATHVDLETGRPVENPDLDYSEKGKWVLPGPLGAHNWQAMSVDEAAGLVYIPAQDNPLFFDMASEWKETGVYKHKPKGWNTGLEAAS
ncbi:hypothetical protein N8291_10835 [Pseudomonadales bacterium]|nr:hypothetical protein [Pseudomonadales bacterium]